EDPQTAYALQRQGALYTALNDFSKSEPLLEEAYAIVERTLGPDHPRLALATMALVMPRYFRGEDAWVVEKGERALAVARKALAADDFTAMALVNNLGDLYVRMGNIDAAEPYCLEALAALEKRFGPDNPRLANPLLNLAQIDRERMQFDRALELGWRGYA